LCQTEESKHEEKEEQGEKSFCAKGKKAITQIDQIMSSSTVSPLECVKTRSQQKLLCCFCSTQLIFVFFTLLYMEGRKKS
jgi:hypothetical protein